MTTAKDFFLHLGSMVGLYAIAISLTNLLFKIINEAYPAIETYNYYYSGSLISLQVAILIIVFPIFILLNWLLEKSYTLDPMKKQAGIKKWLTYITLFVGGIILVGDLVTVLYKFLDGQDLTLAFILKAVVVLIVAGGVFGFYLQEIRERLISGKKVWAIVSAVLVLASIILGFAIMGSPQTQRLVRYDSQKVSDLQNIQWQVLNYWQRIGTMPQNLSQMADPISGFIIPVDPQGSGYEYEYQLIKGNEFKLCATFNLDSKENSLISKPYTPVQENWTHSVGKTCFERTIDPNLYPVAKPVR
ncbi:MAG TPA: DUF5671 domain-containing protein [Candidatus Paceibacterota bacterium]